MNKNGIRCAAIVMGLLGAAAAHAATDWSVQDYDLYPGDFDGDGKTDLLYVAKDASKASGIARSDGTGPNLPFQSWPSNYLGIPWSGNRYSIIVADFNGDAKADLFLQRATAGDSYLLFADDNGKISSISQTISNTALALNWSADQHRILAGDFNNDGKADLFFQATLPTAASGTAATNAVVFANSSGTFTAGPAQTWTDASWSAFKWSTENSNIFVGDFDGDGMKDLLVQARPKFAMIDYDVQFPVPTYPPNMNGVVISQGGVTPFQPVGVQQWSRNANGVDWSPLSATVVIGDFNGDGREDVLLQSRISTRDSYLLAGNASGAPFGTGTALATNVTWSSATFRLVAGNFNGTGGAGIYYQAVTSGGTNYYANVVTGATVTQTAHNPTSATGVLPTTAVGHTVGSFAVTPGGAASYSIPIAVPSGVAGIQPQLSINYTSTGGNGLLGVGWSLGELSEIERCNKTVVQDGVSEAATLATGDRLCLDGNKLRLTNAGPYGAAGSTYQTEIDTFARVTASGSAGNGPQSFAVESKEGLKYEYGTSADSRIEAVNSAASTTIHTWALNKVTDRNGNAMTITYQEDGAPNGSYRPTEIAYTSNANASLTAAYKVVFVYDTRPATDVLTAQLFGGSVKETYRLNRIETKYNEPGVGWRLVRKYQLSYNTSGSTPRSRLGSVQECDKDGNCLAPTMISWQEGTKGWSTTNTSSASSSTALMEYSYAMDINGDGREDLVYPQDVSGTIKWHFMTANSSSGFNPPTNTGVTAGDTTNVQYARAHPIDYFAEGRMGLLFDAPGFGTRQILRWNGSTLALTSTNLTIPLDGDEWVADFTGDGRQDVLYTAVVSSTHHFYVAKHSGATSGTASFDAGVSFLSSSNSMVPYPGEYADARSRLVDFNGDGRTDFVYSTVLVTNCLDPNPSTSICTWTTTWTALMSTGTSFVPSRSWTCRRIGIGTPCSSVPIVADYNGDGFTDVLTASGDFVSPGYAIAFGSGTGLSPGVTVSMPTDFNTLGFVEDYDSDGRADILYAPSPTSGNWYVLRSTGTTFEAPVDIGLPSASSINNTVRTMDLNGDGLRDLGFKSTQYRARLHKGVTPDLLSSIADGFGNTLTVQYAPLTDSTVYTKCPVSQVCTAAQFPLVDIQPAIDVVKSYTVTDGIGGTYTMAEKYIGLRAHAQGRGVVGFRSRETIDSRTGIKVVSNFLQDFPYIGFESQTTTYQPDGVSVISQTINTQAELLPVQGGTNQDRHFTYVQQSEQTSREVGGPSNTLQIAKVTTTQTLDTYGNVTNLTTTTADQTGSAQTFTTVTASTYAAADTTNWCLDFVTNRTVTNTVPGLTAKARAVQYVKDTSNLPACRVSQEVVEPSDVTGDLKVTTTLTYDAFGHTTGQVVSAANIESRTATSSFGSQGVFPTSVTQSVSSTFNQTASKTFDYALGVPLTSTDPNGLTTSFEYDGFGRVTKETRPDGTKMTLTYSACTILNGYCGDSRLRFQIEKRALDSADGLIRTSRHLADAFGRNLYVQDQTLSGAFTNIATNYDNLGRPYQESLPYFTGLPTDFTTISYDLLDRPTQQARRISEADTGTQTIQYSYNRLIQSVTDANLKVTSKELNAIGQIIKTTDAANGITQYEYDQFGNVTKVRDPLNNQIVSTYNVKGFKLSSTDPDLGQWIYTYFATGELRTQRDAKLKTTTFTYDRVSRPLTRVEDEGTTSFIYGTSAAQKNIGQLQSVTAPGAYSESYAYDSKGRLQDATMNADAASFVVSNTYNSTTGLLETITYPTSTSAVPGSRFKVKYEYEYGVAKRVVDFNSPTTVYWEQIATNAAGQPIDELYGNGLHTYSTVDSITGLLTARTTGATAAVQNLTFQWDKVGNLTQRKDLTSNLTENFHYDNLYRLDSSTLNGVTNLSVAFNALGNITSKSGVGTYTYPASGATSVRPHAVTAAGSNSYAYDANGNMTTRNGSTITWYSYNLPNRIDQGSSYSQFFYGANRTRYKQVAVTAAGGPLPAGTETTVYFGGVYERVTKPSGVVEHKHYIVAGKEPVALRTLRSNSINDTRYLHQDHLGSLSAVTDEAGTVVVQLSYDAFGKRRNDVSWSGAPSSGNWTAIAALTHRSFTFHEQLDNVDLVHMNGRVYDPNIGRFISADPIIQSPLMSQSLNRYSYVMNNPLSMIDPSGYSWFSKFHKKLRRHFHAVLRYMAVPRLKNLFEVVKSTPGQDKVDRYIMTHKWAYAAGQLLATTFTAWGGGFGGALWASYYTYRGTGSMTYAVYVGGVNYVTSLAFQAVNSYYGNSWNIQRVLIEGTIGGVSAELGGGNFGDGFKMAAGMSLLNWSAYEMRKVMVAQSRRNSLNSSGESVGMYDDGFKLAGGRAEEGQMYLREVDRSYLGGQQGGPGYICGPGFCVGYSAFSFADYVLESYAGPHDWLSSFAYTSTGMFKHMNWFQGGLFAVYSPLAVIPATPFAIAPYIPTSSLIESQRRR
jgi:RHS repeat-associated protein